METESIRLMERGVKDAIMFKTLMVRGYFYNLCLIYNLLNVLHKALSSKTSIKDNFPIACSKVKTIPASGGVGE